MQQDAPSRHHPSPGSPEHFPVVGNTSDPNNSSYVKHKLRKASRHFPEFMSERALIYAASKYSAPQTERDLTARDWRGEDSLSLMNPRETER